MNPQNHPSSARSKAPGKSIASVGGTQIGDLVYIKDERNKTKARDRYIVVAIDKGSAILQKLTDRFMAKKYNVPLNRLYPASAPPAPPVATLPPEEEESDEDYSNTFPGQPSDNMNNDLDGQDEGDTSSDLSSLS